MAVTLYPHQVVGKDWMLDLERNPVKWENKRGNITICGGILADDPGLGKTYQMLQTMKENPQAMTLFVLPPAIIGQWVEKIAMFFDAGDVLEQYGIIFRLLKVYDFHEYLYYHRVFSLFRRMKGMYFYDDC